MSDCLVNVDANLFRAALLCVSSEEVRNYINGVRIERHPAGGAVMIATDGHRMVVIRDHSGQCKKRVTVSISKDGVTACKSTRGAVPRLIIDTSGKPTIGEWTSGDSAVIKLPYPDWRRLVALRQWPNRPSSFNGKYLGDFGKIAGILGGPECKAIRVICGEPSDPALVLFPSYSDAFGILMPMRADVQPGIPVWMKPVMDAGAKPKAKATKVRGKK